MNRLIRHLRSEGLRETTSKAFYTLLLSALPSGDSWDKLHGALRFRLQKGRFPDLDRKWFSDYLYGLRVTGKLEDPLRVFVTDKEFVKLYVREAVGADYVIPTYAILHDEQEITDYVFPDRCVIKMTHGWGHAILRRNGEEVDVGQIRSWLSYCHYRRTAERNYKNLKPKIIIEAFAFEHADFLELEVYCYRGIPRFLRVVKDRPSAMRCQILDCNWRDPGFSCMVPSTDMNLPRPGNLDALLCVSRRLSAPFESIRVDLYTDGERILVGEMDNCPNGAAVTFIPAESEAIFSSAYSASG